MDWPQMLLIVSEWHARCFYKMILTLYFLSKFLSQISQVREFSSRILVPSRSSQGKTFKTWRENSTVSSGSLGGGFPRWMGSAIIF